MNYGEGRGLQIGTGGRSKTSFTPTIKGAKKGFRHTEWGGGGGG